MSCDWSTFGEVGVGPTDPKSHDWGAVAELEGHGASLGHRERDRETSVKNFSHMTGEHLER